jgi:hypothetical protein
VDVERNLLERDNAVAKICRFRQLPNIELKLPAIASAKQLCDNPAADEDHDAGLKQRARNDVARFDSQTVIRRSDDLGYERRVGCASQQLQVEERSVVQQSDLNIGARIERASSRSSTLKDVLQSA